MFSSGSTRRRSSAKIFVNDDNTSNLEINPEIKTTTNVGGLAILVFVWLTSSTVNQIYSRESLSNGISGQSLVFSQLLFGVVYGKVKNFIRARGQAEKQTFTWSLFSNVPATVAVPLGIFNALGHLTTMWATLFLETSLAHIIRSVEPLLVTFLMLFFGQQLKIINVLNIVWVVCGVAAIVISDMITKEDVATSK